MGVKRYDWPSMTECPKGHPLPEFLRQFQNGLRSGQYYCKECRRIACADWRENNEERDKELTRRYVEKNREQINARQRRDYWSNPEKARAEARRMQSKRWHALSPEERTQRGRKQTLKTNYDLTVEEFDKMLEAQGNRCLLCETSDWGSKSPCVDHNHNTGKIRGILCHKCNSGMGLLGDNPELLIKAAEYLQQAEEVVHAI